MSNEDWTAKKSYLNQKNIKDEIYQSIKITVEGMRVETNRLAIDEIMEVVRAGHYMARDNTIENVRRLWQAGISHQWSAGKKAFCDPQEEALGKTEWILKNHKPKPLDEKAANELKQIIENAEAEAVKQFSFGSVSMGFR